MPTDPTREAMAKKIRRQRTAIRKAMRLLDEYMGDTDPSDPDDPILCAFQSLDRALRSEP